MVARDWLVSGENKERLVKTYKFQFIQKVRSDDLVYDNVSIVDSTVLLGIFDLYLFPVCQQET